MRMLWILALAAVGLAGCNRPMGLAAGSGAHQRYASAGIYPVGRIWAQMTSAPAPRDGAAAKIADDEEIIVTLDTRTGELRQCGNVSGVCVSQNPWAKPAAASAPLALAKHVDQLTQH